MRERSRAAILLAAMACGLANAQNNDLVNAAGRGDLFVVNAILKAGFDVNEAKTTASGPTTALIEASANGHLEVVQALLAAKANVNPNLDNTALGLASRNGHLDVVRVLLAAKADVNAGSRPPLYYAAMIGNVDIVRALLEAKPNLDWRDPRFGTTALMQTLAPWRDDYYGFLPPATRRWDAARLLVEAGANVNVITKTGVTALMMVAEENSPRSLAMVQVLLGAYADLNGGGTGKGTALSPLSDGAQTYSYGQGGYTALGLAASTGSVEVVQALLDANAQRAANPSSMINARQPGGQTPLAIASAKGRADVVRALLAAKADANAMDNAGKTALTLATENGHAEVAELLRSAR